MKDLLLPLVALIAVVAVVYFFWTGPMAPTIPDRTAEVIAATAPPVAAPPQPAKAARAVKQAAAVPEPAVTSTPESIVSALAQPAAVDISPESAALQPAARPIVNPADVSIGMPSRRVVELLGNPSLKTATIRNGSLLETYIYTNTAQGEFVRIQLRGGRVVNEAQ